MDVGQAEAALRALGQLQREVAEVPALRHQVAVLQGDLTGYHQEVLKLPWEMPGLDLIFGKGALEQMLPSEPPKIEFPVPSTAEASIEEQARAAKKVKVATFGRPCFVGCVNFKNQASDAELEAAAWQRSLEKWHFLLTLDSSVSLVGSSLAGMSQAEGMQALRELFGRKKEATVKKRAASMLKYAKYLQEHRPFASPFPFSTEKSDEYIRHLRSIKAKAGTIDSFTEAVRFSIHVVGISCAGEASKLFNPWSVGLRGLMQSQKPERVSALGLTVDQVAFLEFCLDDAELDLQDRYASGAFLFCTFSRSRISDVKKVRNFIIDTVVAGSDVQGYLECATRAHKTSNQAAVQGVSMPLVAPICGVRHEPWGPKFVAVAEAAGLPLSPDKNGPLLPAPLEAGGWSERAVTTDEAGGWLRALLSRGNKCTDGVTGHSLKTTTLDWCGKFGVNETAQTLLGHHALKGSAMYAYMRDKLAAPLRIYERMLRAIRDSLFIPDATRSGLIRKDPLPAESSLGEPNSDQSWQHVEPMQPGIGEPGIFGVLESEGEDKHYRAAALTPEEAAESVLDDAFQDDGPEPSQAGDGEEHSSSSSSSESESSEGPEGSDWVDNLKDTFDCTVEKSNLAELDFVYWRHDKTMTIHTVAVGSTGETFTCGRKRTPDYSRITRSAFAETRLCTNCKKSRPLRDVGALNVGLSRKFHEEWLPGCSGHACKFQVARGVNNVQVLRPAVGKCFMGELAMAGVPAATSFTESKPAFVKRALEVGLAQPEVDHLVAKHVDTLSKLAFVLVPPGKVPEDDAVTALLPAGTSQGAIAGLKRLLFEAHTLIVSALKQRVERTDDNLPASLDVAEREDRLTSQKARLGGLTFQAEEEVAHGAYDIVFAMAQKNELVWLAPEKFGTRRAEISSKKNQKELVIDGTGVAVKEKVQSIQCAINSDLDLVLALRRRALAFDLVGILTFDVANRYHQALVQRLRESPPPDYAKVSLAQVIRADRAAFLKMAETLTTLRRSGSGVLPLDSMLPNILLDPSVAYHLLPLHAGSSSSGGKADNHTTGTPPPPKRSALDEAHLHKLEGLSLEEVVVVEVFCGFEGAPPVLRSELCPEGVDGLEGLDAIRVGPKWATASETAYPWGLCKLMASLLKEHFLYPISQAGSQIPFFVPATSLPRIGAPAPKWEGDSGAKSFQAGSFVHGPLNGVRSVTKQYPESVKAMCSNVRGLFPGLVFGTVGLFRDLAALPHRDANNESFTDNALAALSDFERGSLWMEDPDGDVEHEFRGRSIRGVCLPVTPEGFRFDGRRLHDTMPWNGRRDVIVAYMPRGPENLKSEHVKLLEGLGFVLDRSKAATSESCDGLTKAVIGVYRTPEQFVEQAALIGHPTQLSSLLPHEIRAAVQKIHRQGEANVALERTETLRRWIALASELEPVEKALKADLPEFRKEVLSTKRLALFRALLNEVQHEDVTLVDDILKGFDLTGPTEVWGQTVARRLVATVKASDDPVIDQGVLKATQKELERGFVEGPVALSDVPSNASLTHRFGVRQGESEDGPKIRPIDNYLSSQVNSAVSQTEQISVHTIDIVAGMLGCWLNEWFRSGRSEHAAPVCKAWDLRTAYKQLPLSDSSYELDSYFILFNVERGEGEVYKQRVLPFGSTASVTSFIRAAYAIWKLGAVALTLAWSEYFDDYLNVCGAAFAKHCDFVITMFFKLIGWEVSRDKELSYSSMCVVLGVQINLRDAKLGLIFLENTTKRRPRPVRARRDEYVHIYVDASFEPGGYCGLGGLIFNSSGAALSWFGYKLQQCHVDRLLKDGEREKETVIFELEALALAISLEVFRPLVGRKGVVAFTDNEGVFGSFVRGHSDNSDAQGKAIKTEGRRMLIFDDDGSFCRIQEAFTVASVINPLMAIGKLFREGWELRVNEEEGMCLTDGSSRIPVHLHKNSLAAYAYVQTPSRSRSYSSNNYKMVRTVVQLNKHVQEAVNREEPGWHNTDSMVIVKYATQSSYENPSLMYSPTHFPYRSTLVKEERGWRAVEVSRKYSEKADPFEEFAEGEKEVVTAISAKPIPLWILGTLTLPETEQTKKAMVVTTGEWYTQGDCIYSTEIYEHSDDWFRVKPGVVEDLKAEAAAEELKKKKEEHYKEKEDSAAPPEAEECKDEEMREAQADQEAPQEVVEVLEESFYHEGVEYTAQKSSLKELQALCREYRVKTTGSKKQLLKRLATAVREERLSTQHKEQREHHQAYHLAPPQEPTEEERAYHNLTHLPYQPWCPHCVAMKAREDNHKKGLSKPSSSTDSAKPVISFDFCYTSTGSEEPPAVTLVAVDSWSKAVLAEEREQLENDEAASDPPSSEEPSSPSKLRKQVNRAEETDGYLNMPHDDEVYEADDEFVYESEEEEEETESEPTEVSTKVPVEFFDEEKGPPNVDPAFLQKLDDEATVKEIKRLTKMGVISLVSTDPQEATENVPLVDSEQELHKWLTTKLVKDWRFREATGFEAEEAKEGTTKPKQIQRITKLVPMLALANHWAIYSVDVKVNYDVDSFDEAKKEVTERAEKLKKVEESLEKEKEEFGNQKTEFEETVKRFLKKQKVLSEKETALEEAEENVKAKEAEVERKKKEAEKRERKAQERTVGYDQEREEYAKKYVDDAKKDLERELKEPEARRPPVQYDYKSLKDDYQYFKGYSQEVDALLLAAKDKIVKYKKKVKSLKETIGAALSGSEGEEETEEAYKTKAEEEKEKAEAKAKEEEKKKGKRPKQVETEDQEEKPSSSQGEENTFDPNDIAEFTQLGYVWEFNKKTQEYRAKCEDKKGAPRIKNAPVKGRLLWNKVTECYRRHNVWFTDGKELDKFLETKENEKIEEEVQRRIGMKGKSDNTGTKGKGPSWDDGQNDGWWYNDQWNNENWNTNDDGSNWYENANPNNKGYWQSPEEWAQQNQWDQWTPKGKGKGKKSKNWVQTQ
ncbi:unnamed protein product [Symbiodinium sp. CCMP2592]|nr:unnamed protein product [Symbiodinium sp. CCMP2592]